MVRAEHEPRASGGEGDDARDTRLSRGRGRLRQVGRAGGFVLVTAAMLPPFVLHLRATADGPPKDHVRDAWVKAWARTLLRIFGVEVQVRGSVPPETASGASGAKGRVIVANHRSALDIGVLLSTFGGTMVSRADLARWPLVGAAARSVGTIFVERTKIESGAAVVRTVQRHLEAGRTVVVFPEGTTFDGDEVRPFQRGAFVAAAFAGAEILPVGLAYPRASSAAFVDESFPQHLARMARGAGTRVGLVVGEPFLASGGARAHALATRAHGAVQDLVHQARDLAGA